MAGKHLLIGLIVSQDCEFTVAERRGEEELRRDSGAVLIKTKDNNICAEKNQTAASSTHMQMKQHFSESQLDAVTFPNVSH